MTAPSGSAGRRGVWIALAIAIPLTAGATVGIDRALSHDHEGEPGHDGAHEHAQDGDSHGAKKHEHAEGEEHHDDHPKGEGEHAQSHKDDRRVVGHVELTAEGRKNAGIVVAKAGPGDVSVTLTLPGEVQLNADTLAHVTPRVEGTVREVKGQLGDVVKKGDVLAVLDSKELAALSGEARAAQERLKLARSNFERVEKLFADKIVPEKELIAKKQALAEARIDAESTALMLATAAPGVSGTYKLVAPFDGTIIEKHASLGEVLKDETRVFIIADLSTVWVDISVYAKDLAKVSVGQSVVVRADGIEKPLVGTISFVGAIARGDVRAAQARVVLENPDRKLKPGLFVTAEVGIETVDSPVVIPDRAVQTTAGVNVVFVEEGEEFEARKVRTGRVGVRAADRQVVVEILDGLEPGDTYVDEGSFVLKAELGKGHAGHEH